MPQSGQSFEISALSHAYAAGELTVADMVRETLRRIAEAGDDRVWLARPTDAALAAWAAALDALDPAARAALPLFGIPFAVKDNIDCAGLPTTAACPAFAYRPERDATTVARLIAAGAVLVGKTNLDQFATGLVGIRSPFGVARNPFDPAVLPGGSSSGSAVAVASGLVSFALGTDTAGSGRVPAAFNNLVGLKPTIGRLSAAGVVPACLSLDCVSVFALTVADAMRVLAAAEGFDPADPYSRAAPQGVAALAASSFRFGIPRRADLRFFGNAEAERLFDRARAFMADLGGEECEVDYRPFADAAAILYSDAGVAERTAAVGDFIAANPDAVHPVTRSIIDRGRAASAVELHRARHRLQALRSVALRQMDAIDFLLLPTAGTIYRVAEVEADPITLNSNLGYYTNFVNLMDLAAIAVPAGFQADGLPFGVTLVGHAFSERRLAEFADRFHRATGLPLGASGTFRMADRAAPAGGAVTSPDGAFEVAVFGAHLRGEPLNGQMLAFGGRYAGDISTAPDYRMYRIVGPQDRPGLVRVGAGGASIAGELWRMPAEGFGRLVGSIAGPLCIGTVRLSDGRSVKGFLCEAAAAAEAEDITDFGDWRSYRAGFGRSAAAAYSAEA